MLISVAAALFLFCRRSSLSNIGPSAAAKKKSKLVQEFLGLPQIGCVRQDADKKLEESRDPESEANPGNIAQQRAKDMMQMAANSLAEARTCRK